ncbi:MAG: nitroreductase family protein [Clostridia bacterium]|nr:nitroreductase family protein [Clostridia bacterium]
MQSNHIIEIIKKRTSVRNYAEELLSDEILTEILQAGLYAPSGKNRKPWRFAVIKDKTILNELSNLTVYSRFIRHAPVLILLYSLQTNDYPIEKDILSIGACMQNILLAATEYGYGTCVIGEFFGKEKTVNKITSIEFSNTTLLCGITLGKPNTQINRNNEEK